MLPLLWAHDVAGSFGVWVTFSAGMTFVILFTLVKLAKASEQS